LKPDRTSAPDAADRSVNDADPATEADAKQREVSASAAPSTDAPAAPSPLDTDDAIRTAAKLAIDAGDLDRARALLDLLDAKPKTAAVLALAGRKPR
jgi:hypothetical protein